MGYNTELEIEIMSDAHDMGDDFGEDAETILTLARVHQVSPQEVERILSGGSDVDPAEYAEEQADLDAMYYGGA